AKPKTESAAPAASADSGLRQRVEGLEEQLVDLQVQLGTLESLAKSNGAASASPAYRGGSADPSGGGVESGRIAGLEAQVRTLTQQVQQLTEQVRSLGGQPARPQREGSLAPLPATGGAGTTTVAAAPPGATPLGWTVSPQAPGAPPRDGALAGPSDIAGSTLPPIPAATGPSGGNDPAAAKSAYEAAYQYLLQQDYGAAETAFDDFIRRYPNDGLAGNAQFWLGETHFVRGQFKAAASAFLKGYRTYGRSTKAPDSLLKLAMSLGRLGQKDEACSALGELGGKYPQATADVKSRAAAEKSRVGCP
ncbi:MAG: tol-pal system protein YbgF, partial [Hyphomicrobiaceae bacterium]|nr:tol-pal system protein YbgF [Hyphomicrobiaceae bacterium]